MIDVTIIVCTYNRVFFLEKCLNSLLKQTQPSVKFSLIVVDNNSTDSTCHLISSFAKKFSNFIFLFEPTQGLSHARNAALSLVKTKWVAFLDDDAVAEKNWVDVIFSTIRKDDFDVFGGVYTAWHVLRERPRWFIESWESNIGVAKEYSRLFCGYPSGGNCVYKTDLVREYGGFPVGLGMSGKKVAYGEETKLIDKIRRNGGRVGFVPTMVINHCVLEHKYSLLWRLKRKFALGRDEFYIWQGCKLKKMMKTCVCLMFYAVITPWKSFFKFFLFSNYYWQNMFLDIFEPLAYCFGKIVGLCIKTDNIG